MRSGQCTFRACKRALAISHQPRILPNDKLGSPYLSGLREPRDHKPLSGLCAGDWTLEYPKEDRLPDIFRDNGKASEHLHLGLTSEDVAQRFTI